MRRQLEAQALAEDPPAAWPANAHRAARRLAQNSAKRGLPGAWLSKATHRDLALSHVNAGGSPC
jgi:hypothetical protein